jgi:hypothetical protein
MNLKGIKVTVGGIPIKCDEICTQCLVKARPKPLLGISNSCKQAETETRDSCKDFKEISVLVASLSMVSSGFGKCL